MGQYKVQGEPLVLSHSQERVFCTAHQQEEETAAVTKNTAFRWLALHLDTCRPDFLVFRQSAGEHRDSDSKTEQASPERAGGYPSRSFHLNKKETPPKTPKLVLITHELSASRAGSNFCGVKLNQSNGEAVQQRHCVPAFETLTSWKYQRPSRTKRSSQTSSQSDYKLHHIQKRRRPKWPYTRAKDCVQVPGLPWCVEVAWQ